MYRCNVVCASLFRWRSAAYSIDTRGSSHVCVFYSLLDLLFSSPLAHASMHRLLPPPSSTPGPGQQDPDPQPVPTRGSKPPTLKTPKSCVPDPGSCLAASRWTGPRRLRPSPASRPPSPPHRSPIPQQPPPQLLGLLRSPQVLGTVRVFGPSTRRRRCLCSTPRGCSRCFSSLAQAGLTHGDVA